MDKKKFAGVALVIFVALAPLVSVLLFHLWGAISSGLIDLLYPPGVNRTNLYSSIWYALLSNGSVLLLFLPASFPIIGGYVAARGLNYSFIKSALVSGLGTAIPTFVICQLFVIVVYGGAWGVSGGGNSIGSWEFGAVMSLWTIPLSLVVALIFGAIGFGFGALGYEIANRTGKIEAVGPTSKS